LLDRKARFFGIVDDMGINPFDQGMFKPLRHRPATPFGLRLFLRNIGAPVFFSQSDQPFCRVGIAVQYDILARNTQ
jgi:hypothetical protein